MISITIRKIHGYPTVGTHRSHQTSTIPSVFCREGVFPAHLGNTLGKCTARPVVRTKWVATPGRHMRHQELGVVVVQPHLGQVDGHRQES
jgi:hypothetical protein